MALQLPQDLDARVRAAVRHFWDTRLTQARKPEVKIQGTKPVVLTARLDYLRTSDTT